MIPTMWRMEWSPQTASNLASTIKTTQMLERWSPTTIRIKTSKPQLKVTLMLDILAVVVTMADTMEAPVAVATMAAVVAATMAAVVAAATIEISFAFHD